jgi:hypothetical protein
MSKAAADAVKINLDVAAIIKEVGELIKAAKGSDATQKSNVYNMQLPSKIDKKTLGKPSYKKGSAERTVTWQSVNDDILESWGLNEKSGYDVKFTAGVDYSVVTYPGLVEPIVQDLYCWGKVNYNTVAAFVMSSTMKFDASIRTNPNDTDPRGVVYFDFSLDTGLDREQGKFKFDIVGASCSGSGGW